jgi:hypothetical protein
VTSVTSARAGQDVRRPWARAPAVSPPAASQPPQPSPRPRPGRRTAAARPLSAPPGPRPPSTRPARPPPPTRPPTSAPGRRTATGGPATWSKAELNDEGARYSWMNLILVLEATLNGREAAPDARLRNDLGDQATVGSAGSNHLRFFCRNGHLSKEIEGLEGDLGPRQRVRLGRRIIQVLAVPGGPGSARRSTERARAAARTRCRNAHTPGYQPPLPFFIVNVAHHRRQLHSGREVTTGRAARHGIDLTYNSRR